MPILLRNIQVLMTGDMISKNSFVIYRIVFYIMTQPKIIEERVRQSTGEIKIKKYVIGQFLGKGGFAKCHQAVELDSQKQYAIKIVNKQNLHKSRAKQKLLSEIKIHRALHHQYIVKFYSVFEDESNVYIVLELCHGRSISEMVKKRKFLTTEETRYYIIQLLDAIEYLHQNKVIHRDLKMGNIFLSQKMDVKLGDFGLSAKLEFCEERKRTMAGTPNYIAPEIIDGTGGHSYEVDIWSTGVICFAMLFGKPPFETSELKMTYSKIKNCEYNFPSSIPVPTQAKDFIRKILVLDPKKRMTIAEMLQHPFLRGQRPKNIPRYATQEIPVFEKGDLINYEQCIPISQMNSNRLEIPNNQSNILTSSYQVNMISREKSKSKASDGSSGKTDEVSKQKRNLKNLGVVVLAYVDYSTKYGLGYLLSNQSMGVYFNDSTIMTIQTNENGKRQYSYLDNPSQNEVHSTFKQQQLPSDHNFNKKKMLLQKFQTHLKQEPRKFSESQNMCKENCFVFVKQWLKTKHAIMFRLSNKLFQVDFFDHSQILLKTDTKQIRFKSKKGEEQFISLTEAMKEKEKQTELGRRIKYTKQILNSLKKEQNESGNRKET